MPTKRLPPLRAVLVVITVAGLAGVPYVSDASPHDDGAISVDLAGNWLRRDDRKCRSGSELTVSDSLLTIDSDTSFALFWQIPTIEGTSLPVDRTSGWVRECRRPPLDFGRQIRAKLGRQNALISVNQYPRLTWSWRVNDILMDVGSSRKPDHRYAVRLGVNILKKGTSQVRELAYVWSQTHPVEYVFSHVTNIFPGITLKYPRIVVRSGAEDVGTWAVESRDLVKDFHRIYPGEEPGEILRIYVRAESEHADSPVTAEFRGIWLNPPLP